MEGIRGVDGVLGVSLEVDGVLTEGVDGVFGVFKDDLAGFFTF